jgi:hypothetical protein
MNKIDTWGVYLYALSAGLSRGGSGVPDLRMTAGISSVRSVRGSRMSCSPRE